MLSQDWKKLPKEVQDFVWFEAQDINQQIFKKYNLKKEHIDYIEGVEDDILVKRTELLDLPNELRNMEDSRDKDLRSLSLDLAIQVFWPLNDYLKGVDRLILRLGGKVPRPKHFRKTAAQKKVFPEHEVSTVKKALAMYDDFADLRLSAKKIIDKNGRRVGPTVDNWIKDYIHFLGAGYHNSLQRSKYLSKAKNVKILSEAERESLRFVLTSYDDNIEVEFYKSAGILEASERKAIIKKDQDKSVNVDSVIAQLKQNITNIDKELLPNDFILSEADNEIYKVRNILWQAIGLQDKTKVLSCLKVLITRKSLDIMINEDNRFHNILKRFIGIRYNRATENWFDNNQDKLLAKRLFLEMILVDKLKLNKTDATLRALYLTNLVPDSGQIVYLDEVDGRLKWRDIELTNNQLVWSNPI